MWYENNIAHKVVFYVALALVYCSLSANQCHYWSMWQCILLLKALVRMVNWWIENSPICLKNESEKSDIWFNFVGTAEQCCFFTQPFLSGDCQRVEGERTLSNRSASLSLCLRMSHYPGINTQQMISHSAWQESLTMTNACVHYTPSSLIPPLQYLTWPCFSPAFISFGLFITHLMLLSISIYFLSDTSLLSVSTSAWSLSAVPYIWSHYVLRHLTCALIYWRGNA